METQEKFARRCDATGKGMNEGFCFGDGEKYFKEETDARAYALSIGYESLEEAYKSDAYYHTEWHDLIEEDEPYFDAEGNEFKTCLNCGEETKILEEFTFCTNCLTHL